MRVWTQQRIRGTLTAAALALLIVFALRVSSAAAQSAGPAMADTAPQSMNDAWWTGPMLANNANTLPRGGFLAEPYVYDVIGAHSDGFGSRTYLEYGLANRFTVGLIPVAGFNAVNGGLNSSHVALGDITVMAQYGFTRFRPEHRVPSLAVLVQETFPTGKYDQLGDRPSNAFGAGAYTTSVALNSQTYFWAPNGRILRMRLNVTESFSSSARIAGVSVYGTDADFHGTAKPGVSSAIDWAWEYSVTRKWVLAFDTTYGYSGSTRVTGWNGAADGLRPRRDVATASGWSDAVGFAPAVEYSWKPNLGILLGVRVLAIGRNMSSTVTPAIAINYYR